MKDLKEQHDRAIQQILMEKVRGGAYCSINILEVFFCFVFWGGRRSFIFWRFMVCFHLLIQGFSFYVLGVSHRFYSFFGVCVFFLTRATVEVHHFFFLSSSDGGYVHHFLSSEAKEHVLCGMVLYIEVHWLFFASLVRWLLEELQTSTMFLPSEGGRNNTCYEWYIEVHWLFFFSFRGWLLKRTHAMNDTTI